VNIDDVRIRMMAVVQPRERNLQLPLRPGDLIMTGSPPGVAPLNPGDVIHAGIDGIGELQLRVGPRPARHTAHAA